MTMPSGETGRIRLAKNPTLNGTASMIMRVTRGTVATQYIDHAEQSNDSVKPVITTTLAPKPFLDHAAQGVGKVDIEALRRVDKDRRFAPPIILPPFRPVRRGNFHTEMAVDFSRIGFRDDYTRLFHEPL